MFIYWIKYYAIFIHVKHNINTEYLFEVLQTVKNSSDEALEDNVMEHPYVLMGLIISGVKSFDNVANQYRTAYPENFERVYEKVKNIYYDRLYSFLERLDPSLLYHLRECNNHGKDRAGQALLRMIKEFEKLEQYERCAKAKKLLDAVITFVD